MGGRPLKSTANFFEAPTKIRCVVVDGAGHEHEADIEWITREHLLSSCKV